MPLPVRRGAAAHHRAPVDAHLEAGVLAAGDAVGDLDVDGEADAELARAASLAPPRLIGAQPSVVRGLEQPLERPGVVAGVVDRPHRGGVREGVAGHQVDAPHLGRVHADLGGEEVDRALDRGGGLRAAGPAVRRRRGRVGDDRACSALHPGDGVDPRRHDSGQERQERSQARVGAAVLEDVDAQRRDPAVAGAADAHLLELSAPVAHSDQVLRPGLPPAHGALQPGDDEVLRVLAVLGAEAAADVGGDHPHLLGGEPERLPHSRRGAVGLLGARPDREPAVAPARRRGARLHRSRRHPLVAEAPAHHHLAAVEEVLARREG